MVPSVRSGCLEKVLLVFLEKVYTGAAGYIIEFDVSLPCSVVGSRSRVPYEMGIPC